MVIPIGSPACVKLVLDYSDGTPLQLLNKDFDSLMILAAKLLQLAFLFLHIVFTGKLTHSIDSQCGSVRIVPKRDDVSNS
jgi:hypothetical protein